MAIALGPIIAALIGLLPTLFGGGGSGGGTQERTVTTETPPRGYQSPMLGLMDPFMADQLLRQFKSYSGAGMPGGVGNTSPGLQGILDLLGGDWGELLGQYKTGDLGQGGLSETKASCYDKCAQESAAGGGDECREGCNNKFRGR